MPVFIMGNNYRMYEAPEMSVLVVVVEKGFQGSGDNNGGISAPSWGII